MSETTLDQVLTQRREASKDVVNVDEPELKLVIFALGDAWFALRGENVREILAQAEVFFVPGCPPSLEGVINVRGDIESVVRLHGLLQLPSAGPEGGASILLARGGGLHSGVRVDRVIDVLDVPQSTVRPPPATLPGHWRTLVLGVLQFQQRPVVLLDLDRLFADYAAGLG